MYDLVVALGGGEDRKVKAVQLFQGGQADYILFTGEALATLPALYALHGVNGVMPSSQSTNTIQDFQVIRAVMQSMKFTSVQIVDSGYHAPRSKMIAGVLLYPYYNYTFVTVPSPATKAQLFSEAIATIRNFITLKTGIQL